MKKSITIGTDTYAIKSLKNGMSGWCNVYKDGKFIANAISYEEARRVIWIDIGRPEGKYVGENEGGSLELFNIEVSDV